MPCWCKWDYCAYGYDHLNPQKNLCYSYLLLLAEVLQDVRPQLKCREKSRHQAVAGWLHLVLLRSFSLWFCSLSPMCRYVSFHQSCSIILTFLLLLFSCCYSHGVAPANLDIILISDFSWEETVTRVRMTPSFPLLFPTLSFITWSLY